MSSANIPGDGATPGPEGSPLPGVKLDSWKEIADYLDREVRTVQRWEKTENLPVHRHEHQKKSTVYAYTSELDDWRKNRQPKDDPEADDAWVAEPDNADGSLESGNGNANPTTMPPPVAAAPDASDSRAPSPSASRLKNASMAIAAVALVLLAAYGVYRWIQPALIRSNKVRLVVIPFTNLSGDAKQDYFSAGLTDEMITRLGSLDPAHLGVIAAASSNALAGKPITEIGRTLDVQYALEGSVRRDANRVRIDVQLIQVSDQTHLWTDRYDRDLNDILRVQDDVGTAVTEKIRQVLNPPSGKAGPKKWIDFTHLESHSPVIKVEAPAVKPEAYDAYLRGRFYWTNRGDLHRSIEAYGQAIQKDPQYGLAYAGLASSYALLGQVPYDDLAPSDAKPKAREAAERALQLDPQLAEAHAVLGNVAFSYDWNLEAAEQEFQRAIALGPNNPTSHHWFGHYCMVRNRLPQALEQNSLT